MIHLKCRVHFRYRGIHYEVDSLSCAVHRNALTDQKLVSKKHLLARSWPVRRR